MNLVLRTSASTLVLAAASLAVATAPAMAKDPGSGGNPVTVQSAPPKTTPSPAPKADLHEIIVEGIRQSIENSITEKRDSSQIMDSVTAQDIGQLANNNIAEALQRIPGVQVSRSADGEGQDVQIRGLSENNVELNGEIVSGSQGTRGVDFQDLPPELFSGVQILKTSNAASIEGSLGGTINLQTRAPLKGRKRTIINVTTRSKYRTQGKLFDQDVSGLFIHQFRHTGIGEIGILLNAGYKHIQTLAEVYGGGDYPTAPAIWVRHTGADILNKNSPFYGSTIWPTTSPDVNGDGVSNANDVYYTPNNFGYFVRNRDEKRRSFNGTLQWKPAHNLNIRFDTMLTDDTESLTGSRYSITLAPPFEAPMASGPGNQFVQLTGNADLNPLGIAAGDQAVTGPIYYMKAGRLAGANTRIGAAPAENYVKRTSQLYKLQFDWQAKPYLLIHAEGSISRGSAHTIVQGQLNTGADFNGDHQINGKDWAGIVDYNFANGLIPDLTMYQSPFPAPYYGVYQTATSLTTMNPGNINYARQRYFQYQRNATDTLSNNKTARIDLTYQPIRGGILRDIQVGFRYARRDFRRVAFQNVNQANQGGYYTSKLQTTDPNNQLKQINVQRIPVNPDARTNAVLTASSDFLHACINTAGVPGMLSDFGGNLPTTWGDTSGCSINGIANAFNMIPVRTINPNTGVGYYELVQDHYDVTQQTYATYAMADLRTMLFHGIGFYGNVGARYILTTTDSSGFVQAKGGGYNSVSFHNEYDDWLPSVNFNFALTSDLILRLAYTRTLGRPGLAFISPGIDIHYNDSNPCCAGTGTAGNPNLKPVHSNNLDASLEWYYAKGSYVSVAAFQKKIDSTIVLSTAPVPVQIGSNQFLVNTYQNFPGTRIRGLEFSLAHSFTYLPGILKNLGVTANYTIIDEKSDVIDQEGTPVSRKGLSKYTYNLVGYYDDGTFSVRLAYNWRSAFTRRDNVQLGYGQAFTLPEKEAARGQLDGAIRYKFNRHASLTFNAINITNTGTYRYMKYYALTNYIAQAGRSYNLVFSVKY